MDAGYRCVRFRARAWVVSWSRRLPVKVVGSAASFRYTREVGGVLPLCCAVLQREWDDGWWERSERVVKMTTRSGSSSTPTLTLCQTTISHVKHQGTGCLNKMLLFVL